MVREVRGKKLFFLREVRGESFLFFPSSTKKTAAFADSGLC